MDYMELSVRRRSLFIALLFLAGVPVVRLNKNHDQSRHHAQSEQVMTRCNVHQLIRFLMPFIIGTLLVSCSASQHAGNFRIEAPPATEDKDSVWLSYYQDQFDARQGHVELPTPQSPPAAFQAYQRAQAEWDRKVISARSRTIAAYVCLGIADVVIVYVIINSMSKSAENSRNRNDD